tara:strand:- start:224 stop:412 length:189 start_codon:yes stop_codon:yes gene_type:complete
MSDAIKAIAMASMSGNRAKTIKALEPMIEALFPIEPITEKEKSALWTKLDDNLKKIAEELNE